MLGNNADQFFTTPMRTSVRSGGNTSFASGGGMPAPYTAGEFLPGVGEGEAAPMVAQETKVLGMPITVAVGLGIAAFLFLTPPGAKLCAKIGF